MRPRCLWGIAIIVVHFSSLAHGSLISFDDLSLAPNSSWTGELGVEGGFQSGGAQFRNHFYENFGYQAWDGFAYSNVNNPDDGSYVNQYAVISGAGHGGSGIYAVGYDDHYAGGESSREMLITLADPARVQELWVNNTTYAYWTLRNGDDYGFSKKFGGDTGTDPDWFLATFFAFDADSQPVGDPVTCYLADFRSPDSNDDYILNTWTRVDLSGWGPHVKRIEIGLSSSDVGLWGMNTPAYIALDSVSIIPEPGTLGVALLGWAVLTLRRRQP